MKSVLISIQPKWCEKIISGKKRVEIRKTKPKLEIPFKCYIYCTQGKLKDLGIIGNSIYQKRMTVIGEFVCKETFPIRVFENGSIQDYNRHSMYNSCVQYDDIVNYIGKGCVGYGWEISDLVVYDKPKELSEFSFPKDNIDFSYRKRNQYFKGLTKAPQSWCYVEG